MPEEQHTADDRRAAELKVPRVGRVQARPDASLPYRLLDAHGDEVAVVSDYLRHLVASDFSPASVRSYAQALLRWLRFLWAVGVAWEQAGRVEVRDFVLWLRVATPRRSRRPGAPEPGSLDPRTGKRYLGVGFAPATINHNLAVVGAFYDYQLDCGYSRLRNPVPPRTSPLGWPAERPP